MIIDEKKSEMLDQLAAQAMSGLLAAHGSRIKDTYNFNKGDQYSDLAKTAYEVAASMMAHRARVHAEARRMVTDQQNNAAQLAAFEARQRAREQYSPFATLNS
jgi:hypothetical protein